MSQALRLVPLRWFCGIPKTSESFKESEIQSCLGADPAAHWQDQGDIIHYPTQCQVL